MFAHHMRLYVYVRIPVILQYYNINILNYIFDLLDVIKSALLQKYGHVYVVSKLDLMSWIPDVNYIYILSYVHT